MTHVYHTPLTRKAMMSDKADTNSQEEVYIHTLRRDKSVEELLNRIADFHYVYGRDRSWFMADWTQDFKNAIEIDSNILKGITPLYKRTKPMVEKILAGASEYSAYGITDQNKNRVVETLCELGHKAYAEFKKKNFLLKLAGERELIW